MKYIDPEILKEAMLNKLEEVVIGNRVAALPVVEGLLWASLRGIDSHGIRLLPHYYNAAKGGRININVSPVKNRVSSAITLLDAKHNFGHYAGVVAMNEAVDLAYDVGVGVVSVSNSSHCGALSYFGHVAAEKNMLGIVLTNASPRVNTPGSTQSFFGNNPICLVAPMSKEAPFCFDSATTSITFNAVKLAVENGETLPPGLVTDAEGIPTCDPNLAEQLMGIGGYKGFGLSMMVEILCGLLAGMPTGDKVTKMYGNSLAEHRRLAQFFIAIDIAKFQDVSNFKSTLQELVDKVRAEPKATNSLVISAPGDPEKRNEEVRRKRGITVSDKLMEFLDLGQFT